MTMKNAERALATTVGEVHALFMAVQALAATHPDRAQLSRTFEHLADHGLAHLEPPPIPEATIQGFQHVVEGIRKALAVGPLQNPDPAS